MCFIMFCGRFWHNVWSPSIFSLLFRLSHFFWSLKPWCHNMPNKVFVDLYYGHFWHKVWIPIHRLCRTFILIILFFWSLKPWSHNMPSNVFVDLYDVHFWHKVWTPSNLSNFFFSLYYNNLLFWNLKPQNYDMPSNVFVDLYDGQFWHKVWTPIYRISFSHYITIIVFFGT